MNGLVRSHVKLLRDARPEHARVQSFVAGLLAWWVVPVMVVCLWYRFLARHDALVTTWHAVLVAASVYAGLWSWSWSCTTSLFAAGARVLYGRLGRWALTVVTLVVVSYGSHYWIALEPRGAKLASQDLSTKPPNWAAMMHTIQTETQDASGTPGVGGEGAEARMDAALSQVTGADLTGKDLAGAFAHATFLVKARLTGANLRKADLRDADLRQAYLVYTDLSQAHLENANLQEAKMMQANLRYADLSSADLSRTDMSHTNLSGAYLAYADLSRVDLEEANLTGANLAEVNLEGLVHWQHTRIRAANIRDVENAPDGFVSWAMANGAVDKGPVEWRADAWPGYVRPEANAPRADAFPVDVRPDLREAEEAMNDGQIEQPPE